jgi:hypothetical protein
MIIYIWRAALLTPTNYRSDRDPSRIQPTAELKAHRLRSAFERPLSVQMLLLRLCDTGLFASAQYVHADTTLFESGGDDQNMTMLMSLAGAGTLCLATLTLAGALA